MEIRAEHRLYSADVRAKLLRPSLKTLVANSTELKIALDSISEWYASNSSLAKNAFQPACATLVALFGYTPYIGNVYRVISYYKTKPFSEGEKVSIRTGYSNLQSWTASLSGAFHFHKSDTNDPKDNVILIRLISSGHQVANTEWLLSIVEYLWKFGKRLGDSLYFALAGLREAIAEFESEDEVVMLLPANVQVEVMAILKWNDKRKIVRTKNVVSR